MPKTPVVLLCWEPSGRSAEDKQETSGVLPVPQAGERGECRPRGGVRVALLIKIANARIVRGPSWLLGRHLLRSAGGQGVY